MKLKEFINDSPVAVAMFDKDMVYLAASNQWHLDYDLIKKNVIGQSHYELFDGVSDGCKSDHQFVIQGNIIKREDVSFLMNDGSTVWQKLDMKPWHNKDNCVGGILIYSANRTPFRKIKNEKDHILKLLEEQAERLKRFTHIVSHNLRSHSVNLSLLTEGIVGEDNYKEGENIYFDMLKSASGKLSDTISHLNEVASINFLDELNLENLSLRTYIENALTELKHLLDENQVEIVFDLQGDLIVHGFSDYLESILLNLLSNSVKFRSPSRLLQIKIEAIKTEDFVILSITDNGLGIDLKRHRHKVFGMYQVFHKHKDARGIGLFIAKHQAEAMRGNIELESEVDMGTIFKVYLGNEKV